ncbi:MAG: YdiU family protein [Bacteroidota bacterium]
MNLNIHNRFTSELPADKDESNVTRQVNEACFSYVMPRIPSHPKLLHISEAVATLVGISAEETQSEDFLSVFSGRKVLDNTQPFAMCYGGHQFGHWAGQLGDGRAINLTEIENNNKFYTLQLKGAGSTPYSRRADGLAVLRSSVREHLCSEAMFYLGVPTTRSLSLITTGDDVLRDMLYDGNADYEKGAVVCRVAPSFIRFGSFEIFAARNDVKNLKLLVDFTIKHYFPEIKGDSKEDYIACFKTVVDSTRALILHWQRVGFVHGVMNTDNMSIHGITIDYGPYGWLEDYNPNWTPNTTDNEHKRYAYGKQPDIALWNLYQLANAIFPLIEEAAPLEAILNSFAIKYESDYVEMMKQKLGLQKFSKDDESLISELEKVLQLSETDMTIFFRELAFVKKEHSQGCAIATIVNAFYNPSAINKGVLKSWENWFKKYIDRLQKEELSDEKRKAAMDAVNPKYVLRNYMAQLAIDAANADDFALIDELYTLLKNPYDEQPAFEKWYAKRPDWARVKVGCSMLSCSS